MLLTSFPFPYAKQTTRHLVSSWLRFTSSSSTTHGIPSPQHAIYVSTSSDPLFNLTFEDWLFRHKNPENPLLLVYRDAPCVVIGRNQNPWKEVNHDALNRRAVPLIRRRSGGGTVYHDLGNSNFSIHLPRTSFDRHATAEVVLRAVRSLGIDARVNERNDICVGPDKMSYPSHPFVSGSAYKIVSKRAYHHGTMLISTRLDALGDLLRSNKETMITRGVASVRSPVCNLQQYNTNITHESFTNAVVAEFRKEYSINEQVCTIHDTNEIRTIEYIQKGISELTTWDWIYGQTPDFTYTIKNSFTWGDITATIKSKHGIILACDLQLEETRYKDVNKDFINSFTRSLEGKRYGSFDHELSQRSDSPESDLKNWLLTSMS